MSIRHINDTGQKIPPKPGKMPQGWEVYDFTVKWFLYHLPHFEKLIDWRLELIRPIRILEIGCYEAMSTVWFLENLCISLQDSIVSVDYYDGLNGGSWVDIKNRALSNISKTGKDVQCRLMLAKSEEALPSLMRNRFDLVYIDGDHTRKAVYNDSLFVWNNLIAPGGIVLWDDYFCPSKTEREDVRAGLARFHKDCGIELRFLGNAAYAIKG